MFLILLKKQKAQLVRLRIQTQKLNHNQVLIDLHMQSNFLCSCKNILFILLAILDVTYVYSVLLIFCHLFILHIYSAISKSIILYYLFITYVRLSGTLAPFKIIIFP